MRHAYFRRLAIFLVFGQALNRSNGLYGLFSQPVIRVKMNKQIGAIALAGKRLGRGGIAAIIEGKIWL